MSILAAEAPAARCPVERTLRSGRTVCSYAGACRAVLVLGSPTRPAWTSVRLVTVWKVARLHDIVFDSRHPASLARFWAEVLDGYRVAPYDEEELRRLADNGIDDPEDDPTVLVEAGRGQPRYFFTLVPEGKVAKTGSIWTWLPTTQRPRSPGSSGSAPSPCTSTRDGCR
jgi:hypothetical protein